jgi:hypothetical protein
MQRFYWQWPCGLPAAGINRNDFPREVLFEAILKYVDMAVDVHTRI